MRSDIDYYGSGRNVPYLWSRDAWEHFLSLATDEAVSRELQLAEARRNALYDEITQAERRLRW